MFPELSSQAIIQTLTNEFDPEKDGVAIEIGVGTGNFYSVKYTEAGLKSIAVDPIEWPAFLEIAKNHNIIFEEACIYDRETELTLYLNSHSDLSSLNDDWWGVDAKLQKKVKAMLLTTLLKKHDVNKITFLKTDTEGSEYEILKQLKDLCEETLPKVVEFEYGGGSLKHTGLAGWDKKYFDKVKATIRLLVDLNYKQGLIIDSNQIMPVLIDLQSVTNLDNLFGPNFEYGNFLAFKVPVQSPDSLINLILKTQVPALETTILTYKYELEELRIKVARANYLSRFKNKLKTYWKIIRNVK